MIRFHRHISVLLLSVALAAFSCKQESAADKVSLPKAETTTDNSVKPAETPEPVFQQEGVLEFRSPEGGKTLLRLAIELASDEKERQQGLMWRKNMEEKQGMLFVFEQEEPQSFWMHNTYMPLDMIYVNARFEIVTILKNVPVLNDTPRPSGKPAMYVIEVKAGVSDKYGLKEGMKVAWADWTQGRSLGGEVAL